MLIAYYACVIHYSKILYVLKTILGHKIYTVVSTAKVRLINFRGKTAAKTRESITG
jgi:hypothetical protein